MSKSEGMKGQWLGRYTGSSNGTITINIDERESNYQGVAYLTDDNLALPTCAAMFGTPNKDMSQSFRTDSILPLDPKSMVFVAWDSIRSQYGADVAFSKYADVKASCNEDSLTFSWVTDIGVAGNCILPRSRAASPSELEATSTNWPSYKAYASDPNLMPKRFLFRGQNQPWRLRSSFHRSGRSDLYRFLNHDIRELHRNLSARTRHVFNLQIPDENGAFFNLVQHHGYPTPLLDWTYSPYVAAFFAYRGISNENAARASSGDRVRILVFDQANWKKDLNQPQLLLSPWLYLSIGEFIAIENERVIPQQAASTVTNVDDIESYVKSKESEMKKYLWAFDLPVRERRQIVRELSHMGITAGSLFPGLDGACEELKERNFEI